MTHVRLLPGGVTREDQPAVSVVVPTYQRRESVARAVRSVLAQTFADFGSASELYVPAVEKFSQRAAGVVSRLDQPDRDALERMAQGRLRCAAVLRALAGGDDETAIFLRLAAVAAAVRAGAPAAALAQARRVPFARAAVFVVRNAGTWWRLSSTAARHRVNRGHEPGPLPP